MASLAYAIDERRFFDNKGRSRLPKIVRADSLRDCEDRVCFGFDDSAAATLMIALQAWGLKSLACEFQLRRLRRWALGRDETIQSTISRDLTRFAI